MNSRTARGRLGAGRGIADARGMHELLIRREHVRAISRGHPWVYRQAVRARPRDRRPGSAVDVSCEKSGFIGRGIFDPDAPIAVRMWTLRRDEVIDEGLFARRFREARLIRKAAGVRQRTDAYREVNAEGDRMPGVLVDRWGEWLTMTLQTPSLEPWSSRLVEALAETMECRGIYLRTDDGCALVHGEGAEEPLVVYEPTARVRAFPAAAAKSGLFTDMREARALVAPMLAGRRFLNLFAHTGAWSAAAARAGAEEVVSVDLSGAYLAVARENVELSAPGYGTHTTTKADAFEALRDYAAAGRTFDAIMIDPPSFSSKGGAGTFTVKDGYRPLVRAALRVLEPRGVLVCATNFRGVSRDDFMHMIQDAGQAEEADVRVLSVLGQPVDHPIVPSFPESAYLHVAVCTQAAPPRVAWRP